MKGMDWKKHKPLILNITVTTLVAIITYFVTCMEDTIVKIVILLGSLGVLSLYFVIASDQLYEAYKQESRLNFLQGIPEVIVFKSRTDTYILCPNGDTILIWDFYIKRKKGSNNTYIDFPIFYTGESIPDNPIEVIYMLKNNKKAEQDATYIMRKEATIGKKSDGKEIKEIEGCIHVPLCPQNHKEKAFHILIKVKIKEVNDKKDENYVTVDIPYLTKYIKVIVRMQKYKEGRIRIDSNFFDVKEKNGQNIDHQETANQNKKCNLKNNRILWKAKYPKLGYSYTIRYKINWPNNNTTNA